MTKKIVNNITNNFYFNWNLGEKDTTVMGLLKPVISVDGQLTVEARKKIEEDLKNGKTTINDARSKLNYNKFLDEDLLKKVYDFWHKIDEDRNRRTGRTSKMIMEVLKESLEGENRFIWFVAHKQSYKMEIYKKFQKIFADLEIEALNHHSKSELYLPFNNNFIIFKSVGLMQEPYQWYGKSLTPNDVVFYDHNVGYWDKHHIEKVMNISRVSYKA